MKILQVVSGRGGSSDAYWATRMCSELDRTGHEATLVCRRGTEERVISRARAEGVKRIETLSLRSGLRPWADLDDIRSLRARLESADIVHVHRGKEHWLAALANRLRARPTPLVRTRHIVQPLQPHALNRWLYGHATDLMITVSEAIARQCRAAGLVSAHRVIALPGGADGERFQPASDSTALRRRLGIDEEAAVIGVLSGFRVMKGHGLVVEAATRLASERRPFHLVFAGQGPFEAAIRQAVEKAGLSERVSFLGFVQDTAGLLAALDIALYPPLESDGMSRALFEYLAAGRAVVASRVGVAGEVEVIGPRSGPAPWMPVAGGPVRYTGVPERRMPGFLMTMFELSRRADGDLVYASKTRLGSAGVGYLKRVLGRRPLLLDIDDWETGFYLRSGPAGTLGRAVNFGNPKGLPWTWLAERLTGLASGITVASRFLQQRFGGVLVPHVRDTDAWKPGSGSPVEARRRLGIADERVAMFRAAR